MSTEREPRSVREVPPRARLRYVRVAILEVLRALDPGDEMGTPELINSICRRRDIVKDRDLINLVNCLAPDHAVKGELIYTTRGIRHHHVWLHHGPKQVSLLPGQCSENGGHAPVKKPRGYTPPAQPAMASRDLIATLRTQNAALNSEVRKLRERLAWLEMTIVLPTKENTQ